MSDLLAWAAHKCGSVCQSLLPGHCVIYTDYSHGNPKWKEDLLYWGPCVRLLEIWQLGLANMYVYLMYDFEMAEREICFERRESKQSPSPVGLRLTSREPKGWLGLCFHCQWVCFELAHTLDARMAWELGELHCYFSS